MTEPLLHLLLVDDDDVDRQAVCRLLDDRFAVREAATGEEALGILNAPDARPPDIIVLDFHLPDVPGLTLLDRFAEAGVPVVMLTIEADPESIADTMRRGALDYIVKNRMTPETLDKALRTAIEKAELRRELAERQRRLEEQAEALRTKSEQLRLLATELTLAEQRERQHLAHVLHDDLQQLLVGTQMKLHVLRTTVDALSDTTLDEFRPDLHGKIDRLGEVVTQAVSVARTLTVDLSPPVLEGEGLVEALHWLAGHVRDLHGLTVDVEAADGLEPLETGMRVLLFHAVRELLLHVVKHARANHADIVVRQADGLMQIHVTDDGIGLDGEEAFGKSPAGAGSALRSIRNRLDLLGGRLEVGSGPAGDARLTIVAPIQPSVAL